MCLRVECAGLTFGNYTPDDVVDTNDVLFLRVLRVTDDRGACLQPRVTTALIHKSVVMRKNLALVDHWK